MISTNDPQFPRRITKIDLLSADGGEGQGDLFPQLSVYPEIRRAIGEADELTLRLIPGCDAYMNDQLRERKRLTVHYDDGSFEKWRVTEVRQDFAAGGEFVVKAAPIWTDLARSVMKRTLVPANEVQYHVVLTNRTVPQLLAAILSDEWDCPQEFSAGTVATKFQSMTPAVEGTGISHLEALRQIVSKIGAEWELRWDAGVGYVIDVVEEIGWSDQEKQQAAALPDLRPMHAPAGGLAYSEGNRVRLTATRTDESYVSRVIPVTGDRETPTTIARATFEVTAATYDAGTNRTTVTLKEEIISKADLLRDRAYFGVGTNASGTFFSITGSAVPNQLILAGDATAALTAGTKGRFVTYDDAGNRVDLTYLDYDHPLSGDDPVEQVVRFEDVAPETNVLREEGISDDLSTWTNGLPAGMEPLGAATIAEEAQSLYVTYGTRSAKVTANAGEGIQTQPFALSPTEAKKWYSAWIKFRTEAGSVALELVRSDTGESIPGDDAYSNASEAELSVGGMEPAAGTYRLRVRALEDGTVFYLDAVTLVNEQGPARWLPHMGPAALFEQAASYLVREGGFREPSYEGELLDAAYFDATRAEIKLGSWVRVRDLYNAALGKYMVDFAGRVVELVEDEDPATGRVRKRIRLSKHVRDITDRLLSPNTTTSTSGSGAGSGSTVAVGGDMEKAVYDTDFDGVVDSAEKVEGVDEAASSTYYGKNALGVVGFHALPSDGSGGAGTAAQVAYDNTASGLTADDVQEAIDELAARPAGEMDRATYDADGNGIVDDAERLGGRLPGDFAAADHDHDGTYAPVQHTHPATEVSYDNTASGMQATDVQAALDELDDGLETHHHDDRYYTEDEVDSIVEPLARRIYDLTFGEDLGAGVPVVMKDEGTVFGVKGKGVYLNRSHTYSSAGKPSYADDGPQNTTYPRHAMAALPGTNAYMLMYEHGENHARSVLFCTHGVAPSFSEPLELASADSHHGTIVALTYNSALAVYSKLGVGLVARRLSYSSGAWTAGAEQVLDTYAGGRISAVALSSTRVLIARADGNQNGSVLGCTVSGDAVTVVSTVSYSNGYPSGTGLAKLDGTTAVLAFTDAWDGMARARHVAFDGATVSLGATSTLAFFNTGDQPEVAALSPTTVVVAVPRGPGCALFAGSVNGTSLTFGAEAAGPDFETGDPAFLQLVPMAAPGGTTDEFVLFTADESKHTPYTYAMRGRVSGTTIDAEPAEAVGGTYARAACALSAETFLLDHASGDHYDVSEFKPGHPSGYLGITQAAGLAGEVHPVAVLGAVSEAHSGLVPGRSYWIDVPGGAITTEHTGFAAGVAISPAQLLLPDVADRRRRILEADLIDLNKYSRGEVDRLVTSHAHDDRYYTETEVDDKLAGKSNVGHTHTKEQITDFAHGHQATEVSYDPAASGMQATDVKAALDELAAEKADATHDHDGTYAPAGHTHPAGEITGLGTAATKNITISSTAPASPAEGDIWLQPV